MDKTSEFDLMSFSIFWSDWKGYSSASDALCSISCCTLICPQKLNTFLLIDCWNPFTNEVATIMMATLNVVAVIAKRMIKPAKDLLLFRLILLAIKKLSFNEVILLSFKIKPISSMRFSLSFLMPSEIGLIKLMRKFSLPLFVLCFHLNMFCNKFTERKRY